MKGPDAALTSSPTHACPTCGGQGIWHPAQQEVVCPFCATAIALPEKVAGPVRGFDLLPLLRDRPDSGREWQANPTRVRCTACGSVMEYAAGVAGRKCDACASPALVACDETGAPVSPSGVLPFRITEADARARLAAWLEDQPRLSFKRRRSVVDTMRATYLPCWTFTARVRCPYRGEITRVRQGERRTVPFSGTIEHTFDEILVPASRSLPSDLLQSVEPFPVSDVAVYDTRYLAGYVVELYAVNMWDAWDIASQRMQEEVDRQLKFEAGGRPDTLETWPEWTDQVGTHILVPAYAITYRHGTDTYAAVVNGWTGKVAAKVPHSVLFSVLVLLFLLGIVGALGYGLIWMLRAIL